TRPRSPWRICILHASAPIYPVCRYVRAATACTCWFLAPRQQSQFSIHLQNPFLSLLSALWITEKGILWWIYTVCMNSISANHPTPMASPPLELPMVLGCVRAGFPSPAEDFGTTRFDLAKSLIQHPATTFVMPLRGDSMIGAG